ncbi:MAG: phosphomannomutase/phosphoglucomutase [Campylobacterales bacterium]
MQTIFREYDIRGIYQQELTKESVNAIGYFLGEEIKERLGRGAEELFVGVGYDARTHSPQLYSWLSEGLINAGLNVLEMGLVTTGVNYFTNFVSWIVDGREVVLAASIMITGSHNPPEYNGFKITLDKAPFYGKEIAALGEKIAASGGVMRKSATPGKIFPIDAKERYIAYLVDQFAHLRGFAPKLAIDCGNGVAGVVLPEILSRLGIKAKFLYVEPDGTFPNHHPDPSEEHNLEDLKHTMQQEGNDLGIAFDGDADRIAVLTPHYNIKGDELALIFARDMARSGKKPVVIGEVKCSKVMYDEIDKLGTAIMHKTGHSNLKVKIRETNADLAAEVSGHLFFNDRWFGFDDAIYVAMRVLELVHHGVDLDREVASMPKMFSTDEIKVKVTEETKFPIIDEIKKLLTAPAPSFPKIISIVDIDGVRVNFEHGWGLVRASNTTPVLVTRFEASTPEMVELYKNSLNALIEEAKAKVGL